LAGTFERVGFHPTRFFLRDRPPGVLGKEKPRLSAGVFAILDI